MEMNEKHGNWIKVWMPETLKRALQDLADMDDRKTSDYVCQVLMDHVHGRKRRLCEPLREGAQRGDSDRRRD